MEGLRVNSVRQKKHELYQHGVLHVDTIVKIIDLMRTYSPDRLASCFKLKPLISGTTVFSNR